MLSGARAHFLEADESIELEGGKKGDCTVSVQVLHAVEAVTPSLGDFKW